jgi:hypothetical protein
MAEGGNAEHEAARRLYDLAMDFAERALRSQSDLVREFETLAAAPMAWVGAVLVDDDDDEHLVLQADGHFAGRAMDDDTERWEQISSPADVADHYDPVDLFTDLADAVAEMFPGLQLEVLEDAGMVDRDFDQPAKVAERRREVPAAPGPVGLDVWSDAPPEPVEALGFEAPPDRWEAPAYEWNPTATPAVAAPAASGSVATPGPSGVPAATPAATETASAVGPGRPEAADAAATDASRDLAGANSEQLRVLEDLMKAGVMSKEQFDAAKAKLTRG